MRSVREEFRRLIDTFDPKSREYWRKVGETFLGLLPDDHVEAARGLAGWLSRLGRGGLGWFGRQIAPLLLSLWFSRQIHAAMDAAKGDYEIPDYAADRLQLSKDDLKDAHKLEVTRREQFTRKAQAYLMGVTVGTSFVIGMLGLWARAPEWVNSHPVVTYSLRAALLLVVLWLFMAAFAALRVIAPSQAYDTWLQERLIDADEEDTKKQLVKLILLNQGYNLIAANHLQASSVGMRNGVILVFIILLLMITVG
jgi:hypothetical protein